MLAFAAIPNHRPDQLYPSGTKTDPEKARVLDAPWDLRPAQEAREAFPDDPVSGIWARHDPSIWPPILPPEPEAESHIPTAPEPELPYSAGQAFFVSSGRPLSFLKRHRIFRALQAALSVFVTEQLDITPVRVTVLEEYEGMVERIENGSAAVSLYDKNGVLRLALDIPKGDFAAQGIPFQEGTVFAFSVERMGQAEIFRMRHLPASVPQPDQLESELAKIKALCDEG